jgi:hypothetical protein
MALLLNIDFEKDFVETSPPPFFPRRGRVGWGEFFSAGRAMNFSARNIDKKKAFTGVILVCLAVFMMLFEGEGTPFFMKTIRVVVLSVGLGFYIWGRFFSRGGA